MEIIKGIGVSPGVSISTAVVLDAEDTVVPRRAVAEDRVAGEIERVHDALKAARHDLADLAAEVADKHGKEIGGIFDFHLGMLRDPSLEKQIVTAVSSELVTAEFAVSQTLRKLAGQFEAMSDRYLSERVKDVHDIERRVLRTLIGDKQEGLTRLTQSVIVVAHDLLPSQTAQLDRRYVVGFGTDVGGRTSHTAIVARAMSIPAVVGLGNATLAVAGGDTVIIDGTRGLLVIDPTDEQLEEYKEYGRRQKAVEADLATLRDLPAETGDGQQVALMANIEFPAEIDDALARGATGIGLVPHRVSVPVGRERADGGGALPGLPRRPGAFAGQAAGHPHAGPRGR